MKFTPSPEFRLVAACLVWPPRDRVSEDIAAMAAVADWEIVIRIVKRHRVAALFGEGLKSARIAVPAAAEAALAKLTHRALRNSLKGAAESRRIQEIFERAQIPLRFLKGAALAQLAFGSVILREAKDIDILVLPGQAEAAMALVEAEGYRRIAPAPELPPHLLLYCLKRDKHCEYIHPVTKTQIELHWRLTDNADVMPGIMADGPCCDVQIGGGGLRTLPEGQLFAYLCRHGAGHGWSRLKWLADIAALVSSMPEGELERRYDEAASLGVEFCAAQALLLCRRIFATKLPPVIAARLDGSRRTRWLERLALRHIDGDRAAVELNDQRFGSTSVVVAGLLLGRGWRYRAQELSHQLVNFDDIDLLPLPVWLFGLYPALRVPLWLWRRLRQGGRSTPRFKSRGALLLPGSGSGNDG